MAGYYHTLLDKVLAKQSKAPISYVKIEQLCPRFDYNKYLNKEIVASFAQLHSSIRLFIHIPTSGGTVFFNNLTGI